MNFTRESIFIGAIRSFCTSLATILGIALAIGVIVIALAFIIGPQYLPPKSSPMIMPDAQGNRAMLSAHTPAILRIDIRGVIGAGDLTSDKIEGILLDSREDFLQGNRVKGILLYVDTPGGTSTDADSIYRALMAYKQKYNIPIYAFVDGYCASGGMYIACTADKIYATPPSVIGSVGVILGPMFNFSEAMTKVGVGALTLSEGKGKDELDPFRAWKPDEAATLQDIMVVLYDRFTTLVSTARPQLTKEKLINDYGAHVFVAKKAEELGYIDVANTDYSNALQGLTEAAKIDPQTPYQVVQLVPPHPLLNNLAQVIAPKRILESLGITSPLKNPELSGKLLYLYQP
jgi:signal peptide peptidase SppA